MGDQDELAQGGGATEGPREDQERSKASQRRDVVFAIAHPTKRTQRTQSNRGTPGERQPDGFLLQGQELDSTPRSFSRHHHSGQHAPSGRQLSTTSEAVVHVAAAG